jgi:hypothetical protein
MDSISCLGARGRAETAAGRGFATPRLDLNRTAVGLSRGPISPLARSEVFARVERNSTPLRLLIDGSSGGARG